MPKRPQKKKAPSPPSRLYRRIAFTFLAAVFVLLGVVLYYSLAYATIVIKPRREAQTVNLVIDVREESVEGGVRGTVREKVVQGSRTFPLAGAGGIVTPAPATGSVVIKNTTSRNQPLVRTTRLLSRDGVLFRISETVVVPAGGEVQAAVYADEPGRGGEIGPTRFTIPGLWEGLQDKIYGESTEPMCCGTKTVRVVTALDLASAKTTFAEALVTEAGSALRSEAGDFSGHGGEVLLSELIEEKSDTAVGEERTEFTLTLKLLVTGVFYDQPNVYAKAEEALKNLAGEERELVALDPSRITVTVERRSVEDRSARLALEAAGLLVLRPESSIFRTERLIGLDRAAVESYFKAFSSIESVRVEFRPPWLGKIPRLKDHIEIRIEE